MAALKTQRNDASVDVLLDKVDDEKERQECVIIRIGERSSLVAPAGCVDQPRP